MDDQLTPGSFKHTLNYLVEHEIDTSIFREYCNNDATTDWPACDPAMLIRLVLFAHSCDITSSHRIEWVCRQDVVFMVLSTDSQPHFTITLTSSRMHKSVGKLFLQIAMICDQLDLIGKEMLVTDGSRVSFNIVKERSATYQELADKKSLPYQIRLMVIG